MILSPFIIGVLGDFSGQNPGRRPFSERHFVTAGDCIRKLRAAFRVSPESPPLFFGSVGDFAPDRVYDQIKNNGSFADAFQATQDLVIRPEFRQLEASWIGLQDLLDGLQNAHGTHEVAVKVLDVSREELAKDLGNDSLENTILYRLLLDEGFGTAGVDHCFGLLVVDHEFVRDDLDSMVNLARIAAEAFCPAIVGIAPGMFDDLNKSPGGFAQFDELQGTLLRRGNSDLSAIAFEDSRKEDAFKFLSAVIPRIVFRSGAHADRRRWFSGRRDDPLWGSPIYALARSVAETFKRTGWFYSVQDNNHLSRGYRITNLALARNSYVDARMASNFSVEVALSRPMEQYLNRMGFVIVNVDDAPEYSAISSTPTCWKTNSEICNGLFSDMRHVLLLSRIVHAIKAVTREPVGSLHSAEDACGRIHNLLSDYQNPDMNSAAECVAERPLESVIPTICPAPGSLEDQARSESLRKYEVVVEITLHSQLGHLRWSSAWDPKTMTQ